MKLVRIKAGTFSMGSPKGEREEVLKLLKERKMTDGLKAEGPEHEVEITQPFHLGVYEVTQKEFTAVMGYNPSYFSKDGTKREGADYFDFTKPAGGADKVKGMDTDDFPVENVSHEEAKAFCEKLSSLAKEKQKKRLYRLPTEAEWEYACRGGAGSKKTPFHYGDSLSSDQANFDGNYPYGGAAKGTNLKRTCKVGSYKPNDFGLYDMHGNVFEWCGDRYGEKYYADSPAKDPAGPSEGSSRVIRGGDWGNHARGCRSAFRLRYSPTFRYMSNGFRVALVPSKE